MSLKNNYLYFNIPVPTKILVVGGYSNDTIPSGNFVEIIDLLRPKFKCKFFHERSNLLAAVGGIISNQPVICGGFNATTYEKETKKCIVIGNPNITMEMLQLRQHEPSGVVIDSSKIWIVGKIYLIFTVTELYLNQDIKNLFHLAASLT